MFLFPVNLDMTNEAAALETPVAPLALDSSELTSSATAAAVLNLQAALVALTGGTVSAPLTSRLPVLQATLEKVNKRAVKLGCTPIRLAVLGSRSDYVSDARVHGGRRLVVRSVVALFGLAPKVAGYTFAARIEHTPAGNILARCPVGADDVDLTKFHNVAPVCEHCNMSRSRKDTFVVREDATGKVQQIGRNCLADFIRSTDVETALKLWKLLHELTIGDDGEESEFGGCGGRGGSDTSTLEFLTFAVASVATDGFHKSGTDRSTRNNVSFLMGRCPRAEDNYVGHMAWHRGQPTPEHVVRAQTVLAWCIAGDDSSDYLRNLRIAATLPNVGRHDGILASAPIAYAKHVEGLVAKKREATEPPKGAHVGVVGKRLELGDLTVIRVRYSESEYGTKTILALETAGGDAITWFASGAKDLETGTVLKSARATIKEHSEYKGRPQTVVQRMVWEETPAPQLTLVK